MLFQHQRRWPNLAPASDPTFIYEIEEYITSDLKWHASKDETYAQRRSSAGPTSSMVGQHWTSTAPMSRGCRGVHRKVWLYNLDYNRGFGCENPFVLKVSHSLHSTSCGPYSEFRDFSSITHYIEGSSSIKSLLYVTFRHTWSSFKWHCYTIKTL